MEEKVKEILSSLGYKFDKTFMTKFDLLRHEYLITWFNGDLLMGLTFSEYDLFMNDPDELYFVLERKIQNMLEGGTE